MLLFELIIEVYFINKKAAGTGLFREATLRISLQGVKSH